MVCAGTATIIMVTVKQSTSNNIRNDGNRRTVYRIRERTLQLCCSTVVMQLTQTCAQTVQYYHKLRNRGYLFVKRYVFIYIYSYHCIWGRRCIITDKSAKVPLEGLIQQKFTIVVLNIYEEYKTPENFMNKLDYKLVNLIT